MKYYMTTLLLLIMFSLTSCSNDDDNNQEPQLGFFPTKIIINDGGTPSEMEFTYDNKNQIALITSDLFNLSFSYNANGLIGETRYIGSSDVISISYEDDILTSLTYQASGNVIPVDYTDGTYSTMGPIMKLNEQNQVLEIFDYPITYSNTPGPFSHLKFQPALFISTDIAAIFSYYFTPNEITELESPFDGVTYTVVNTRDANNNIVLAQLVDPMGAEGPTYSIEYEQRPLSN